MDYKILIINKDTNQILKSWELLKSVDVIFNQIFINSSKGGILQFNNQKVGVAIYDFTRGYVGFELNKPEYEKIIIKNDLCSYDFIFNFLKEFYNFCVLYKDNDSVEILIN